MYKVRTLRARDLLLPMAVMILTFVVFIYFDHADMGWLIGMSVAVIGLVASMYRDAGGNMRFVIAIGALLILHVVAIIITFHMWKSIPAKLLSPLFYLDFIAMALLIPKLTGLAFDATNDSKR